MDPSLLQALMAYFNSEPAFAAEFERVRAAGDTRSPEEWMYDHIQSSPGDMTKFRSLAQTGEVGGEPTESLPLEQALLETALPRLLDDIAADDDRAAMAAALQAQATGDYDLARQLINKATSGEVLRGEMAAADTAAGSRRSALTEAVNQLRGAQAPLDQARIREAQIAATGVGLGLERTLDQLDAERALQGYVGRSTMDTNAAVRASLDAQQRAAGLMGAARVANATDSRGIGGFGAAEGYSIEKALADRKEGLYGADFGRSLQAALSLPMLTNQLVGTRQNIDNSRNSGLARSLGLLNWWSNNASAPGTQYDDISADTSGNDLAGLGAGLVNSGFNIAQANNWWKPTTQTTPAATYTSSWKGGGGP